MGSCLFKMKNYREAVECYNKVLEFNSEDKEALSHKGYCLYYLKRYDLAEQCFNKILKTDPNFSNAWYNKACLESIRNNQEKAIEFLEKAIELNDYFLDLARNDKDFANIRDSKEFKDLIEEFHTEE